MKSASRTLVKSPPEVWEQLDHVGRMEGLMSALVGHATPVEVYERVEESKLAWKADGDQGRIEVELAEKGWGTNVSVSAENGEQPTELEGWLDAVLDELATPQKRPFEMMTKTPADTVARAVSSKQDPEPEPKPEPTEPPFEEAEAGGAEAERPKAEASEPEPAPTKRRRLFGIL